MRIAVFGGSFDPIHNGHLIVARFAGEAIGADHVRLIPAGEQPLKRGQHRASAGDRATMTGLAIEGNHGLVLDRCEVERDGPSYTVDTLRDLTSRFPKASFSLLLGRDAAAFLPEWREPDQVRSLAEIVILNRAGEQEPSATADRFLTVPRIDISSTAVRERVKTGRSIRYWVPDGVAQYIDSHRLYRD